MNTEITINRVENHADLYCKYQGQYNPQPTYIWLDPSDGTMGANSDGEIGGAVPFDVWHGRTRRYHFGNVPTATSANRLMEDIKPLVERVCAGYSEYWDGNNTVGKLTDDAEEAETEIENAIAELSDDDYLAVWEVAEYYYNNSLADLGVTVESTDDEIKAAATKLENDADAEGVVIDGNIYDYIKERIESEIDA